MAFLSTGWAEEEFVYLPANTVVYKKADCDLKKDFSAITKEPVTGFSLEKRNCRFDLGTFSYCFTLHKVVTEKKGIFWASPQLQIDPVKRNPVLAPRESGKYAGTVLILFTVILFYLLYHYRSFLDKYYSIKNILYAFSIVLFHSSLCLYFASQVSVLIVPVDEQSYFSVAKKILAGEIFHQQYFYTIGWPLVMTPFIILCKAGNFLDIESVMTFLNLYIFMPSFMVLVYFILKKYTSSGKALAGVCLYRIATFLLQYQDFWSENSKNLLQAISFTGIDTSASYQTYNALIQAGNSAQSDILPCFLIALMVFLILYLKPGYCLLLLISAIMGVSCLVRVNCIMFAPLILFVLYFHYKTDLHTFKSYILYIFSGAAVFFLVFGWQLWLNHVQFGNSLTFPYVLHPDKEIVSGFLWKYVIRNSRYMFQCLYPYFMCGFFSLLFTSQRFLRSILALWIIPLVVFYLGYSGLGGSCGRFMMPVLIILVSCTVLCDLWGNTFSRKFKILSGASLLLQVIFTTPSNYTFTAFRALYLQNIPCGQSLALWLNIAIPVILFLLSIFLLWRSRREMLISWMFIISYASGCIWLIPAAMLFIMGRFVYDFILLANIPEWLKKIKQKS